LSTLTIKSIDPPFAQVKAYSLLAENDAVFENFLKSIGLVDLFTNDRLDPVEYFFLLLLFAALLHTKTAREAAVNHPLPTVMDMC